MEHIAQIRRQFNSHDERIIATCDDAGAFMYAIQRTHMLSRSFLIALACDMGRNILPYRVSRKMLSWCPSLDSETAATLEMRLGADAPGLYTLPWHSGGHRASLEEVYEAVMAGEAPVRAICVHHDLTPEYVADHPEIDWIRSCLHPNAFGDPC
jgi:hypothetical protein